MTISSTYIRACVAAGDMVVGRRARSAGRTGSTASSSAATGAAGSWASRPRTWRRPPFTAIPADGVYAGHLVTRDARSGASRERFPAAISVGTNPTFQGSRRTVEAYVLDFDGDLYGERVGVEFVAAAARRWRAFDASSRWSRRWPGRRRHPDARLSAGRPAARSSAIVPRW